MKFNISIFSILLFLYGASFQIAAQVSNSELKDKPQIEEIKIAGETLAAFADADYVFPRFSPDGKQIAYSKVLIEKTKEGETENSEIHLYDLQKKSKAVLLNANQTRKFATYASFVADLQWLDTQKLRAHISDGDVDAAVLTFNTQTRRLIKTEYEDYDSAFYPAEMESVYLSLIKIFPEIPKDIAVTAFNVGRAFKIGNRGVVVQFAHVKIDSNIRFFDFQTREKYLLVEESKDSNNFGLLGAFETAGKIFFAVDNKDKTRFFVYQNADTTPLAETVFGGSFQLKFISDKKAVFLLKQPNYEAKKQSSLWLFDGDSIKRITDVENLSDTDIAASGKMIAFCFSPEKKNRRISIRKVKIDF